MPDIFQNTPDDGKEPTDADFFGEWVYCAAHLAAHRTGWCTVPNSDKLGLGSFEGTNEEQARKAHVKCKQFRLDVI